MNAFDLLDKAIYLSGVVALCMLTVAAPGLYREARATWRWSKLRTWIRERMNA